MTQEKPRFILVGCGRIGHRHAVQIEKVGSLVAHCDTDMNACNRLSMDYPFSLPFHSHKQLIESNIDADIVCICTPNYLHSEQSIRSLNAGYHVLCEKPMAMSVAECQNMNKAAHDAQKRLFVVKQNRFNPPVVKLKEWLVEGKLGPIYSVQVNGFWNRNEEYFRDSWKGSTKMAGGILHTQFSHFIDIASWLFGELEYAHTCSGKQSGRKDFEFDDTYVVGVKFKSGALGNFHFSINSFKKNMEGSITVLAEKGSVKIGGQYLNKLEYCHINGIDEMISERDQGPNDYGTYQGSMSNHNLVYKNIIEALNNNTETITGEDGIKTLEMIEKITA